jgi:hypothetical protein
VCDTQSSRVASCAVVCFLVEVALRVAISGVVKCETGLSCARSTCVDSGME